MLTASAAFAAALTQSHAQTVRVTAYSRAANNTRTLIGTLPVQSGTLTIDSDGAYWRTCEMVVGNDWTSSTGTARVADVLNVANTDVTVEWGLDVGAGSWEWLKVATLRVDRITQEAGAGQLRIVATDEASRLGRFDIISPYPSASEPAANRRMIDTIKYLVGATYPAAALPLTWHISTELNSRATWEWRDGLIFQGSRWDAVKSLADALGGWIYQNADGEWSGAKLPALSSTPIAVFASGDYQSLVRSGRDDDRDEIANVVYVRYESPADGSAFAEAKVTDPGSVWYYLGPAGKQVKVVDNDLVSNATDAQTAADDLLVQYSGIGQMTEFDAVLDPRLFPGDHVSVELVDGSVEQHIIRKLVLPFPSGRMTVTTRLSVLGV